MAAVAVAIALMPLRTHVLNTNLALVLVLVILGAALVGGRAAGVSGALAAALAYDVFLTVPYGSLKIERSDDIETTVLLALIGLACGGLVEWARRHEATAAARRRELDQVHRRTELAAGGERPGRLIDVSAGELTDMLRLASCSYVPAPVPDDLPVFTHTAIVVPAVESDHAPEGAVALPVRAHGRDLGHFVLVFPTPTYGISVPSDTKHAAVALADQLGMALLRYHHP